MKMKLLFAALIAFWIPTAAQDANRPNKYANLITEQSLRDHLTVLASDALEGRETGKRGQKMAAAFIKAHFEELGLSGPVNGNYFQPVILYSSVPGNIYIKVNQRKFLNFEEIFYYGSATSQGEVNSPVIFVSKGTKEDFDQVNVEGKTVLVNLQPEDNFQVVHLARLKKAKMVLVYPETEEDFLTLRDQFTSDFSTGVLSLKKPQHNPSTSGLFIVSPSVASQIMNLSAEKLKTITEQSVSKNLLKKVKPGNFAYRTGMEVQTLKSENVLGYLEGTDKKDELIVITAHYDHIGKLKSGEGDLINNGADDDGSGTVAVMELAKAFAKAKLEGNGPRRSILFLTVTGEEKGLLGSDYYTQFPVFPLANTIVNLNIDMVGRRDEQHEKSTPYVYLIGSDKLSLRLHHLSESINKANHKLLFDYTYNDQNHPDRLYYRSDHWNFAKNNIPVIFYFDGIHEDYHKPSDEINKIEFDLLKLRTQTIFLTAWEIANMEERISPDQGK
jgi:Zn-dependent M28 family amino/carboxypeptidase